MFVKVHAYGIYHTDLLILDGELARPTLPLVIGHEIVGTVVNRGAGVTMLCKGGRVGIPWLGYSCGHCKYCLENNGNLCENASFTGYTINGGYSEYTVADERYCFLLVTDAGPAAAPLLCAGVIGYRCYSMTDRNISNLGIYGFGAAAHILIQVAIHEGNKVYAFSKEGELQAQHFTMDLCTIWAGDSYPLCPVKLGAAVIIAPVGKLVPKALADIDMDAQ